MKAKRGPPQSVRLSDLLGLTALTKSPAAMMHIENSTYLQLKRSETFGVKLVDFPAAAAGVKLSETASTGGGLVELTFLPKPDINSH